VFSGADATALTQNEKSGNTCLSLSGAAARLGLLQIPKQNHRASFIMKRQMVDATKHVPSYQDRRVTK